MGEEVEHERGQEHSPSYIVRYNQPVVRVKDWTKKTFEHPGTKAKNYVISLFPIAQWIYRYNLTWLYGDLIAGITVGCVVVPQGMSYAQIATLPPEYGLYSSFVGVFIYCFFATSKDVSIGPVAVMSLQVSKVIAHVVNSHPEYADDGPLIATTLALICGAIAFGIGLLRLGFILEFIPVPAVMGFMTGSALNIAVGQVPAIFGIQKRLNTRAATYLVIINTLKNLKYTTLDAAFGLVCLFILYFLRWSMGFLGKRYPKFRTTAFYLSVLRNAFVIIFATLISWGVCRSNPSNPPISIIKTVPRGLKHTGVPDIQKGIIDAMAGEIPVSVIILLLEHIAISKSFGRINDYKIIPDQELIAIGVTNLIGIFFSAYPATGSFSRSALKSKCGVRTPIAGIYTGIVVLLATYALTSAFYFIPNAALSAIIIHAVGDLIAHPRTTFKFWRVSPVESVIFLGAVLMTIFVTIESGIYFSIAASLVFLLLRIAKNTGNFLGRIEYIEVIDPVILDRSKGTVAPLTNEVSEGPNANSTDEILVKGPIKSEGVTASPTLSTTKGATVYEVDSEIQEKPTHHTQGSRSVGSYLHKYSDAIHRELRGPNYQLGPVNDYTLQSSNIKGVKKYKWVPLNHKNINPDLLITPPPPGVVVFRPGESFTYPNCSRQADEIMYEAKRITRPGVSRLYQKLGDRPWNDHGPRHRKVDPNFVDERPLLKAVILDFSSVPQIDSTGVQNLVDIRGVLCRYADREVEFHFVGILSPWVRRALIAEGFGGDRDSVPSSHNVAVGPIDRRFALLSEGLYSPEDDNSSDKKKSKDEEQHPISNYETFDEVEQRYIPVVGTNTPYFHLDIPDIE